MSDPGNRSTGALLTDLANTIPDLMRKEVQLLRAEIGEKTSQAGAAIGMIVGGVVLLLVGLNVLAAALVVAIAELGVPEGWAALGVGVVFALVAWMMISGGTSNLKGSSLAPERTGRQLRKDAEAVKETTR